MYSKRLSNFSKSQMSKHKIEVIKSLATNDNIKILSFDKGYGVAIMNSEVYVDKLEKIVNDPSKFQKITHNTSGLMLDHPIIKAESSVKYFLNRYVRPYVDTNTYHGINPVGTQYGQMYGTVKVHKEHCPLRPIVASYGTPEYGLAKYLNTYIIPVINTEFSVSKNTQIINDLAQYNFSPSSRLVSFDIESLYTNVPLQETIAIAADKVYSNNDTPTPPFSKEVFIKLLTLANTGIFSFNDTLYKQIDGLAMGNPLAPSLANLFLGELENKYLGRSMKAATFYRRYMDDTLVVFESDNHGKFLEYLNSWHPNIKFTTEFGGKQLPFLDIQLDIQEDNLNTSVYRKPTYTSLLLNFQANCPMQWKTGLIYTLLNRAYTVCNSWYNIHIEINKLRDIFGKNGYPVWFLDKYIKKVSK